MPLIRDPDLAAIRRGVERVGKLSDGLLRLGPFRLGIDGVLSWIPGVGEIYSGAAAVYLLVQGARARVPLATLVLAGALMGGRTLITAIPFVGPAAVDLLALHGVSARLIVRAIDRRLASGGQVAPDGRGWGWRGGMAGAAAYI
ncbi:MAG: DUF4112 domain-containing protein [Pseudomonadota bacterium]|nr:DUF4112 domain-containing protein [Pseudomonadota bacterium]